ncbi:uncharacterized protein LOC119289811 [Triticum dicoccoides]|uniref:uncharacterized protein LOC119289811 n=1 Tax=Triticum dicoccoides TaxID=85692 RepID=UPI00188DD049|nr:uncharacterized protein LOC119289811 [Triticum dicoccoides]
MQQAKVKVKDGASALRAKAKIVWAKLAKNTEAATSRSHNERQLAHESGKAKVGTAEAQLHQEKVAHREAAMEHRLHKNAGVGGHNHKHGAGGVH